MNETISVNGTEYEVERLLGKGKGGYSYLVRRGGQAFVLKQIHHEPCAYYSFGNKLEAELHDHARLLAVGIRMPALIDADRENERILKEYIDGPTVYELVLADAMKPEYFDRVREMCAALYPAGLNIDYFPTNFVARDGLLYYVDYECNPYSDEWNFENWGVRYWSKTPELIEYVKEHG